MPSTMPVHEWVEDNETPSSMNNNVRQWSYTPLSTNDKSILPIQTHSHEAQTPSEANRLGRKKKPPVQRLVCLQSFKCMK